MLAGLRSTGVREIHYRHADGHPVPALATTSIIRAADGAPLSFLTQVESIEARQLAELGLIEGQWAVDAVISADSLGRITAWNAGAQRMFGPSRTAAMGRPLSFIVPERLRAAHTAGLRRLAAGGASALQGRTVELAALGPDGAEFPVELTLSDWSRGGERFFTAVVRDISARKSLERELLKRASTDQLTGLANRSSFTGQLQEALGHAVRTGRPVSVLALDLDRFGSINTSLGPAVGDRLLHRAAGALSAGLREGDRLARVGGDEFAVLLPDNDGPAAVAVAARLRVELQRSGTVGAITVPLDCSVGVATYQPRGAGGRRRPPAATVLLRNAALALDDARTAGGGATGRYRSALHTGARRHLSLHGELRHALDRGQLAVHYQPLVHLGSAAVCGAEALLRWRHPRFGSVAPSELIPLAEDNGLIVPIGQWILERACAEAATWPRTAIGIGVSVNVSRRQLADDSILDAVAAALAASGLAADRLTLELTESVLMADGGGLLARLHRLRALGVRLAIDDFGTGYSSLAELAHLPVDQLKIDKSFVDRVDTDPRSRVVAAAVIALGQTLGHATLAEGIETPRQREVLLELGCEHGQGYLFGRPVTAAEFVVRLGSGVRMAS